MTRRSWFPAIALFLAVVVTVIGSIPRDAMGGAIPSLVPVSERNAITKVRETNRADVPDLAAFTNKPAPDVEPRTEWTLSAGPWFRVFVLVVIIAIILLLIYRNFTGWKPMNSQGGNIGEGGKYVRDE